jgi:hypothetical protein
MIDSERFKLLYGPYSPPKCRIGDKLPCEYRGREVKVRRITDAPIQWPATRGGPNASPILCGDLIRAVRVESEIAVAHHWGVTEGTVCLWRRALGVPPITNGTRRLRIEIAAEVLTPEVHRKAVEATCSPEARAKRSALLTGRAAHPNTVAGLLEAAKRPKSEKWKRDLSQRTKALWEHPEEHGLPPSHQWKDEEIALLGTDTDGAIARRLGLAKKRVSWKRAQLGIPSFVPRPERWTEHEIASLGTAADPEVARKLGKSVEAVCQTRRRLGIPPAPAVSGWTEDEIALLGTDTDGKVAAAIGRSASAVTDKRRRLKIRAFPTEW